MKAWARLTRQRRGEQLAAASMLGLWLVTVALTACPQLHHLLHEDAHSTTHTCLVTHIQQHLLAADTPVVVLPIPPAIEVASLPSADFQFLPTGNHRLASSRAPPLQVLPTVAG